MNAVDEDQTTRRGSFSRSDLVDSSVKEPPLKTAELQSVEGDIFEEGEVRLKQDTGFDGGTLDLSMTSSSSGGERTINGNEDSSQSLPNGVQNGSVQEEGTEETEAAGELNLTQDDTTEDFKENDSADVCLKEDSIGCGTIQENDSREGVDLNGDSASGDQELSTTETSSGDHQEPDSHLTFEEFKTAPGGDDKHLKDFDFNQGEREVEDRISGIDPEEIVPDEEGEIRENETFERTDSNNDSTEDGEVTRDITENSAEFMKENDANADSNSLVSAEVSEKIDESTELTSSREEAAKASDSADSGSRDFKDDSNSADGSQPSSRDGSGPVGLEKDEDPDALTMDTDGRWLSGEGESNKLSPEGEKYPDAWSVVDKKELKNEETVLEKSSEGETPKEQFDEEGVAPIPSQPPSDDDVDPDALTIDTAALEEDHLPKNEGTVSEPINGEISSNPQNLTEPSLDLPIRDVKKIKKAVSRKLKKNVVRLGRSPSKGVKRRVQRNIPSSGLKCPRCPHSSFTTVTALLEHQRSCGTFATPSLAQPDVPKVPRKVYMCSACGSYFENWNLFLHMKEMHKRNICLHCLGMFSQAGKLTQHLAAKHGVVDQVLEYGDQLAQKYPGPQFLLCSRCDRMCTDQDFESHSCSTVCSHCGLAGTHYPTCRLAPPPLAKPAKAPRRRARAPKRPKKQPTAPVGVPMQSQESSLELTPSGEGPSPADELSPTTYNERMLQLYRGNKPQERSFSTLESIEESINRVVGSLLPPEEEMDTNQPDEPVVDTPNEPEPEPMEEAVPPPPPPVPPITFSVTRSRSDSESSDSEKLTIELEPRRRHRQPQQQLPEPEPEPVEESDSMQLAGEETPFTCVPLPEPLDKARVPTAMKLFLRATALTCVYCAHARKIAVNARQLALHQLAQHRYVTVADNTPTVDKAACHAAVVRVVREALPGLEDVYFNAYGFDSSDRSAWRSADRVYDCFHCSYITPDLREFTSHNRKIHCNDIRKTRQSESHLCIMCKTRFLSYSELLCHLCAGVYVSGRIIDPNCRYRCYCCDIEPLPSSFRLMVHLRQTHTACDMCFTLCDSQAALSAHILKHKSLFYCYACALTYETRMELSKHIFWKHGAESVTCKRCLQKKWRHAYHFCLPPPGFTCDTCGSWFKTAATLRVHARLHAGEFPHACTECPEKFISRKLLAKHAATHVQQPPPPVNGASPPAVLAPEERKKQKKEKKKDLRELFDLPPVNLSESDDSSGDEAGNQPKQTKEEVKKDESVEIKEPEVVPTAGPSSEAAPVTVWDGVLASLEEKSNGKSYPPDSPFYNLPLHRVTAIMLADHDYCRPAATTNDDSRVGLDHDYCNNGMGNKPPLKHTSRKNNSRRNRSSSSDSSSSSSSSCSCGSNCSCSSSTSSTESASSGEPRPPRKKTKAELKAEKRKEKASAKAEPEPEPSVDVCEVRIQESDLETDEPITDDDQFYELNPALRASEVLRLNRSMLLDKLESVPSLSQPPVMERRKGKSKKKRSGHGRVASSGAQSPRGPRPHVSHYTPASLTDEGSNMGDSDGRRPRRKRVPLKFYGFSSGDEDDQMAPAPPRKKERIVEHNTTTAAPPPAPEAVPEPSNLWNPPAWRPPPVPPRVHPIKIRTGSLKQTFAKSVNSDEFHIKRAELGGFQVNGAANSASAAAKNEKLYCFCQCPYDEVSEMIACDAHDCAIEWFHFECVGIMDPPKGKWFCPDCKKKAAAESEMMSIPLR